METINGLYKADCSRTTLFYDGRHQTVADIEDATASGVRWYNLRRLHSSLGMVSPDEYEATYYVALTRVALPTEKRQGNRFGAKKCASSGLANLVGYHVCLRVAAAPRVSGPGHLGVSSIGGASP